MSLGRPGRWTSPAEIAVVTPPFMPESMKSMVRWRGVKSPKTGWTCESISPGSTVVPRAVGVEAVHRPRIVELRLLARECLHGQALALGHRGDVDDGVGDERGLDEQAVGPPPAIDRNRRQKSYPRPRRATAAPGRDERWGVWGAISGPPIQTDRYARRSDSSASRVAIVPSKRIWPFSMM